MKHAALVVDFRHARCGSCKVAVDELAEACPICHARFDRVISNHAGLANQLLAKRSRRGGQKQVAA